MSMVEVEKTLGPKNTLTVDMTKGFLGVTLVDGPAGVGVRIESVDKGDLAAASGLCAGDVIVALNGEEVNNHAAAKGAINAASGKSLSIEYRRVGGAISQGQVPAPPKEPTAAVPEAEDAEKMYELEVPPNTVPGSKLKLTIPGMQEKVIITVPEGAAPGATISFCLPSKKGPSKKESEAAVAIQAILRGKAARASVKLENGAAAATKLPSSAAVNVPSELLEVAPAYQSIGAADEDGAMAEELTPVPPTAKSRWGFLKRVGVTVVSALMGPPAMPPTSPGDEASAQSFELFGVASAAITAWEAADFDAFAAVALPSITVQLPSGNAEGMQGVWTARLEQTLDGFLSVDTMMASFDGDDSATVVRADALALRALLLPCGPGISISPSPEATQSMQVHRCPLSLYCVLLLLPRTGGH
jgi:hypothetical protein